jgi:hypothetical protein
MGMPVGNSIAEPLSSTFGIDPILVACAGVLPLAGCAPPQVTAPAKSDRAKARRPKLLSAAEQY